MIRRLCERVDHLWLSRSWTTRAPRPGEGADAYTFVSRDVFEERIAAGGFLEYAVNVGEYYGTPLPEAPSGDDVVFEIDVQGAKQVQERCEDVVCVFLVPPSRAEQEARLRARGDDDAHVQKRLELAEWETAEAARIGAITVVNDEVEKAVDRLAAIIFDARAADGGTTES